MAPSELRIDLHTHILPENWPNLSEKYGYPGFVQLEHVEPGCGRMVLDGKKFRDVAPNCWCPKTRISEIDRHGVDVQVLSTVPVMFNYWARPEHTLDLARFLNDHIAETVAAYPQRFVGLGTLPMQSADLAVRELERCVRELGLPGVEIGTHVNGMNLDEPALFPFFEAAHDLGAAVFVHPWDMLGKERMPRYWLPWLVGMPAETSLAICSMIFGGVFERLPRLRVAFAHGGGSFPASIGRLERAFTTRPDLCAVDNDVPPRAYLGRFWVDSIVHDADVLRYLLGLFGARRVALGSDYPFPLGEAVAGSLVDSMTDLGPEDRESILSGSALEFLALDRARFVRGETAAP